MNYKLIETFLSHVSMICNFCDFCCSVLTPYYKENVQYSNDELKKENEDGISILFYLTMIYPGEYFFYMLSYHFFPFNAFALMLFPYINAIQMNGPISMSA
jgi:hypothetical protein